MITKSKDSFGADSSAAVWRGVDGVLAAAETEGNQAAPAPAAAKEQQQTEDPSCRA